MVSYGLAQRVLAKREQTLVPFDEIEDAFAQPTMEIELPFTRPRPNAKAWKTRLLEPNPKPTLWMCNSIQGFDPAYLRRFALVVELPRPGLDVRRRILGSCLEGLPVSDAWIDAAAADERLTPALAERAASTLRLVGHAEREPAQRFLSDALAGLLDTQGPRRLVTPTRPARYDLRLVNASIELGELVQGLAQRARGTVCLHGPPGTGKTDFVRFLAAGVGRPLIARRASDLLGKYVAETERMIAQMFREARDASGLLLLDEADGFLRDRAGASRSWEITQVNELLVQMEACEGIFVCTTNLYETLDAASLRRFDVKVRFDALREEQRRAMFAATLGAEAAALEGDSTTHATLARLAGLTPGDFATAVRRAAVLGKSLGAPTLLAALEGEWKAKPEGARRRVGFGRAAE